MPKTEADLTPPPAAGDISIRLIEVSKFYSMGETRVTALDRVSLEITAGEFIVLLGPSGSGKTTLLNLVGGLDTPTSGQVIVNGFRLDNLKEAALTEYRRRQIGFVFQFFNLIPTLTARENVELAATLVHDGKQSDDLLREVGLGDRLRHFPSELSGGENQRVAIARALATNPTIVLCDEPTGSLDYQTGKRIYALLRDLSTSKRKTVIVVTHNSAVGAIADRVIKLRDGRVTEIIRHEKPLAPEQLSW